jgi:hypothetical protein
MHALGIESLYLASSSQLTRINAVEGVAALESDVEG